MGKGVARLGFVDPEPQSLVTAVKLGKGWTGKDCSKGMVSNKKSLFLLGVQHKQEHSGCSGSTLDVCLCVHHRARTKIPCPHQLLHYTQRLLYTSLCLCVPALRVLALWLAFDHWFPQIPSELLSQRERTSYGEEAWSYEPAFSGFSPGRNRTLSVSSGMAKVVPEVQPLFAFLPFCLLIFYDSRINTYHTLGNMSCKKKECMGLTIELCWGPG